MNRALPLFLGFVLLSSSALAQGETGSTVQQLIDRALDLEASLEYEQAAEILLQVIADDRATDEELMEANLRAGIIQRIIDNDVEARLHFVYVLKRDPQAKLPEGMPPKISAFFELVRKELAAETRDPGPGPGPNPDPDPQPPPDPGGNPVLFWSGAGTMAVGALLMVGMGSAAALGELTYADTNATLAQRESAQAFAPIAWGGVGVGAALGVIGAVLMVTGL